MMAESLIATGAVVKGEKSTPSTAAGGGQNATSQGGTTPSILPVGEQTNFCVEEPFSVGT